MIGRGYIVEGDLFDISARIKQIDGSYFVFYSYEKKRYEVHSTKQRGSTLSVVLPYDRLDSRAVEWVNKTRSENASKVLAEAEKHNELLEKREMERAVKHAEFEVERALAQGEKYEYS